MKIYTTSLGQLGPLAGVTEQAIASIKTVLDAFAGLDAGIYRALPSAEFTRLIQVIICIFTLLQNSSALDQPGLDQFGPYLEALQARFKALSLASTSNASGVDDANGPRQDKRLDAGGLWTSVLGVVRDKYARLVEEGAIVSLASMCPAVGADFRQTDYWDFVEKGNGLYAAGGLGYPSPGDSRAGSST
jgi:hypothetical protein